jgi:hypothetical protein
MDCMLLENFINDIQQNHDHWRMLSEDLEPKGGDTVMGQAGTEIFGNNGRETEVVRKELCYQKAETLEDAEEAAWWWRYNLV